MSNYSLQHFSEKSKSECLPFPKPGLSSLSSPAMYFGMTGVTQRNAVRYSIPSTPRMRGSIFNLVNAHRRIKTSDTTTLVLPHDLIVDRVVWSRGQNLWPISSTFHRGLLPPGGVLPRFYAGRSIPPDVRGAGPSRELSPRDRPGLLRHFHRMQSHHSCAPCINAGRGQDQELCTSWSYPFWRFDLRCAAFHSCIAMLHRLSATSFCPRGIQRYVRWRMPFPRSCATWKYSINVALFTRHIPLICRIINWLSPVIRTRSYNLSTLSYWESQVNPAINPLYSAIGTVKLGLSSTYRSDWMIFPSLSYATKAKAGYPLTILSVITGINPPSNWILKLNIYLFSINFVRHFSMYLRNKSDYCGESVLSAEYPYLHWDTLRPSASVNRENPVAIGLRNASAGLRCPFSLSMCDRSPRFSPGGVSFSAWYPIFDLTRVGLALPTVIWRGRGTLVLPGYLQPIHPVCISPLHQGGVEFSVWFVWFVISFCYYTKNDYRMSRLTLTNFLTFVKVAV